MDYKTGKYNLLIRQYKSKIFSYALYMLRNRMDAEDVTQEVFIRIWQNEDKFNILSAKTWIMRSTHNLCIDFLRRRTVSYDRNREIDEVIENTIPGPESHQPGIITEAVNTETLIKQAVMNLPENLKSVFVLYEIEGLKYSEISKTLNMPQNSAKVYLMRARLKLRDDLKKYDFLQ